MHAGWTIHHTHGDTAAFHAATPDAVRSVTFHTVERPTLALGSAQRPSDVDGRVADALGVDVVRRRSGGGAVLMLPGEFVWADVVIPAGDPLWDPDVARAMVWVGEWWVAALASFGVAGVVHRERLLADAWSRQVCWTGVGTGEVVVPSSGAAPSHRPAKLVGISQRRTRQLARFQTMLHLRWRPELVAALVAPPRPASTDLAPLAAAPPLDPAAVHQALVDALATLPAPPP